MTQLSKIVMIDCQTAGVAGDMFLGALLDLGADKNKVIAAIKSLENEEYGYKNIVIDIKRVIRKGFSATKIDVTAEGKNRKDGTKLIEIVEQMAKKLKLSPNATLYASNVIHTLVQIEAKIHGNNQQHLVDAHLHEVGLVDTVAEIIGSAVAIDDLGLFDGKIISTPVAVGGGLFQFSHGTVSSPSPATIAIFESHQFPIKGGPVESELATPTGAAILVNFVLEVNKFYPEMVPIKVGYGAGTKEFPETANVLRITIGRAVKKDNPTEQIAVLETNIDDITGEIIGHSIERLYAEGAKDVSIIPMVTKKNRPGQIIKVIADQKDVQHLSGVLINETGTLGVRICFCERHIIKRDSQLINLLIDGVKEPVKIKVSKDSNGKIIRIKPEFDDLRQLSNKTKISLRELSELALAKANEIFSDEK
jgi:pyridinium-3,5-bisthiocarboxylic acid mononucleotide nickel chelatase